MSGKATKSQKSSKAKTPIAEKYNLSVADGDQIRAALRDGAPHFSTNPEHRTSPHNSGNYGRSIQALFELGENKPHAFKEFKAKLREISSMPHTKQPVLDGKGEPTGEYTTAWQRFIHKGVSARATDEENAKDQDGKIIQNLEVLQRRDYGKKLLDYGRRILKSKGAVIEITLGGEDNKELFVALNTDSATPINQRRTRTKPVAKKVKAKAKTVKAKAKSSKPKATKVKADPAASSGHSDAAVAVDTTPAEVVAA